MKEGQKIINEKRNGMGIASLVLGICSVFFVCLPMGVVGICLAVKQRKIYPNGIATAGFVLSIIGTVLGGIWILIFGTLLGILNSMM